MTMIGADPDQLDALAAFFETTALTLDNQAAEVSRGLGVVYWQGGRADNFRNEWQRNLSPGIRTTVDDLRDQARLLRENATEQREVSETSTRAVQLHTLPLSGRGRGGGSLLAAGGTTAQLLMGRYGIAGGIQHVARSGHFASSGSNSFASYSAQADISAHAKIDGDASIQMIGGQLRAQATASAELGLFARAEGAAELGGIATATGAASAMVGVRGRADGSLLIGPDGVEARLGGKAFIGAAAEAEGRLSVGDGAIAAGGRASAYAGFGAEAGVRASASLEEISIGVDLGLAIGVGGALSFDVSVSPEAIAETMVEDAADILENTQEVLDFAANAAGDMVGDATGMLTNVGRGISGLWN